MLKSLTIKNYALIQGLQLSPHPGLNMITGETGAGKSIMLGALGLLLGNRADSKVLYDSTQKCVIEGFFEIAAYGLQPFFTEEELDYESTCIIRREISATGKSRAFINDTPVRLEHLKKLGAALMDIHSQHDTLQLANGEYQLALIDAFSSSHTLLAAYQNSYRAYRKAQKRQKELQERALALRKEADYNRFQLEEIEALQLKAGEQAELEQEQELLTHAEDIKSRIQEVVQRFEQEEVGLSDQLDATKQTLGQLARFSEHFASYQQRFESCLIEIKDIMDGLYEEDARVEVDEERLSQLQERLSRLFQLQQKHGVDSVEELLALAADLAEKVIETDQLDEQLEAVAEEVASLEKELTKAAAALSEQRQAFFAPFSEALAGLVRQLGMENAQVRIAHSPIAPGPAGTDEVELLFSANKGVALQPLRQVASGGEFSRLIFAIKYLMADKIAMPTLIFDEIDTGISGEVALKMVLMMQDIARKHQVICISHLPQVAAKGERHYFVYKDHSAEKTVSKMRELTGEERVLELAKMIAGDQPPAAALESARSLLA
ncbi:DNA repair protein RecN [Nitritalea halalkaliphila LW7]|uniref:DNA repair protein RecN n=1 Tax=Nitritalea halalkaliphila LW7 TaxID=1189621 RepID=I5C2I7_9BACT|nr:DNA repair protein RecN [Nitritalea halalkaliphila]EIM76039.1 DNA repair protein RecN [Nitritalea halalkaliphila LW7]